MQQVFCDRVVPATACGHARYALKSEAMTEHWQLRDKPLPVDGTAVDVNWSLEIMRYELSDYEWTAIKPMLPNKPRSVRRVNDHRVLNGIF